MHIKLHPTLVCRTPAFSTEAVLVNSYESLKEKIETASPAFYTLIKNLAYEDLPILPEKANFTLWKYFNRAKFRATPYGTFAGISLIPANALAKDIILEKQFKTIAYTDWSHKTAMMAKVKASEASYFCSNSSYYFVENEIRYICYQNNQFELSSVHSLPELAAILILCRHRTSLNSIISLMKHSFDLDNNSTLQLLDQLLNLQLLHCELQANITGTDYFKRLGHINKTLAQDYVLAHRAGLEGTFDAALLKHIPDFFDFMARNLPAYQNNDLNYFKKQFIARFEQQEISLAVAMDPELGIGYGDLAQQLHAYALIAEIKGQQLGNAEQNLAFGAFEQFLLNQLLLGKEIKLELFDKEQHENSVTLPNTFSLLFEVYQGNPVIYAAGGCAANALLGRFSLLNEEFNGLCRSLAEIEQNANPDVAFFDIAYQAEHRVDNVNRRRHIYESELPILTWSEQLASLDFEDIMVSVQRNEVILRSKKLGKRIVPRLATAYNYNRSDLAAFRFLCDLQHQQLNVQLGLKLEEVFPKLNSYPRVSYKGIILSPARWLFSLEDISELAKQPDELTYLSEWLRIRNIKGYFKVGNGDQTLMFDTHNEADLRWFIKYAKLQSVAFYLSEGLCDAIDAIKDENGEIYHPQYIASYYHEEQLYQAISNKDKAETRIESPGGEWLYFEIYTHPNQANYLLQKLSLHLLKPKRTVFKSWFFIRYTDPKPHLRIRLQLKNVNKGFELLALVKEILSPEIASLVVNDLQLKTYYKEQERYGEKRMPLVELFFAADSELVLKLLKNNSNEENLIQQSLKHLLEMVALAFSSYEEQLNFAKQMAGNFAKEMKLDSALFKQLNLQHKKLNTDLTFNSTPKTTAYFKLFTKLMESCQSPTERMHLTADLIHMHVNRVFKSEQRVYETILYQYLQRVLQQQFFLSKQV